tara:strand:+ start:2040 stop:2897 length:858 start_codon:yes stop_codon:yes gene_type:complete
VFSQNAILEIDTNLLRIGEQFNLALKVYEVDTQFVSIIQNDSLFNDIDLIEQTEWQSVFEKDTYLLKNFTFTSFDTGSFIINPLSLLNASNDTIFSNSLVVDFIAMPVDTTNQFFDIKPPKDIPFLMIELLKYVPYLLLLILCVLIFLGIWKYFQKKNNSKFTEPVLPSVPLDVYFLDKLDKLLQKKYIESEKYKYFYTELSEIFRGYLEKRFNMSALESSTYELKELLYQKDLYQDWLNGFFRNNDIVKFARGVPSSEESFHFLEKIKDFIVEYSVLKEENDLQ